MVTDGLLPPWRPRGVETRGRTEAVDEPSALIRIYPDRIVSWGIESNMCGERHSRAAAYQWLTLPNPLPGNRCPRDRDLE